MLRAPHVCTLSYLPIEGTREFNRATRRYFPLVPLCSLWLCMSSWSQGSLRRLKPYGVHRTHTALELEVVSINPPQEPSPHVVHEMFQVSCQDWPDCGERALARLGSVSIDFPVYSRPRSF